MTEREVLKLALEALENNKQKHHYCEDTWYSCPKHEDGCANEAEGDECNCGADEINAQFDKAITAIKEALAQPEQYITDAMKVRQAVAQALLDDVYAEELEQPEAKLEQEPVACVYKATTKKGEVAHFGEYSAAKAWAGWGTVERVPLKTLTPISKSTNPCPTCESLARSVMLDQTSHDTTPPQRTWVGLTDEEIDQGLLRSDYAFKTAEAWRAGVVFAMTKLKQKNVYDS